MNEPPIGWNGKTLQEMLQESEEKLEEIGRYQGIRELELRSEDRFRYECAYARLRGALVSARETALHVSASPIVKEIGELCFALYSPEGDSIAVSTGIMVHVHTMSEGIKFMIRENYEEKVGINPGDIFLNNDPQCGNVHTTDVQTLTPIFWEDELVGWVGGVTHQVDTGGIVPGHDLVPAIQRFDDGTYYTCRKIGSHNEIWEDHLINARRSVRTPMYWELDEKCRLAGCLMIKDAVHEFIEEEGIDYYKQFIRETIEEGRITFIKRVKERLIPGRYADASFGIDAPFGEEAWQPSARRNVLNHEPIEIEIRKNGEMALSFEGASAPGHFPFNSDKGAMEGGQWVLLTQCIIHGDKVNDGAYYAVDTNYPEGTWCNPGDPMLSYQAPWGALIPAYTGMMRCLSRGFYSRGYREEVVPGYGFTGDAVQGGGVYESGPLMDERWALSTFEISGQGLGASAVADGHDWGYAMWNPESDLGDIEEWELIQGGIPYLSRKVKPNTAGHGKYRGGAAYETVATVQHSKNVEFFGARDGLAFHGSGMSGGYPQATGYRLYAKNTNLDEIAENRDEYPLGDSNPASGDFEKMVKGEITRKPYNMIYPITLDNNDLVYFAQSGGPGYGDPLERKLEFVKKDLEDGIFTEDIVYGVYGVVAEYDEKEDEWIVDEEATKERREEIRREREEKSVSYGEFWREEKEKITAGKLINPIKRMYAESIDLSEDWGRRFLDFWNLPEDFEIEVE